MTLRRRLYRTIAVAGAVALVAAVPYAAGAVVTPTGPALADASDRGAAAIDQPIDQPIDQQDADALRSAAGTVGAVVTVRDGDTVTSLGSGSTAHGKQDVPDGEDKIRIASNTKSYAATIVLQLVGEGRLELDKPIGDYLPGLVKGEGLDEKKITVRQLLQHTSGIADHATVDVIWDPTLQWFPPKPEQLVPMGTRHGALFAPGSDWKYSNTNYVIAGLLIEKITGKRFGEVVDERIVKPLGLANTKHAYEGQKKIEGPHFDGYLGSPPLMLNVSGHEPGIWAASGAMVSSGSDMTRFHSALAEGKLLSPELLAEMQKVFHGELDYGLGLFPMKTSCGTAWGHNGLVPGYTTFSFADGKGRAVFAGINGHAMDDASGAELNKVLTDIFAKGLCGDEKATATFSDGMKAQLDEAAARARAGQRKAG